jgi:hypothetical protein
VGYHYANLASSLMTSRPRDLACNFLYMARRWFSALFERGQCVYGSDVGVSQNLQNIDQDVNCHIGMPSLFPVKGE